MNEKDKQLTILNQELTDNFQQSLTKINNQISHEHWLFSESFKLNKQDITEITKEVLNSKLSIKAIYFGNLQLKLQKFVTVIENNVKEQTLIVFEQQLNSVQNGYLAIIAGLEQQAQEQINNANLTIKVHNDNLQLTTKELQKLKVANNSLQEKLTKYETRLLLNNNWQVIIQNQQKTIQAKEHFLENALQELTNKFQNLEISNCSKDEQILILKANNSDYEKLLKTCTENIKTLQGDLNNTHYLLMENNRQQLAQEATIIRLENEINVLKISLERLEDEKTSAIKIFNEYQEKIDKERLVHKQTLWENSQLKNQKQELQREITELELVNQELRKKLEQKTISLEITTNNLEELQRLNLISKVKLQSILCLDTMRIVLPESYGKVLTKIEGTIFIAGFTNYPTLEKSCWLILILYLIGSVCYSTSKLFQKIINKLSKKVVISN